MAAETDTKTRFETAKTRLRSNMRRGRHAYIGLHGLAYDRFLKRREQAKEMTENLFSELTDKGETTVQQAEVMMKYAQKKVWKNYAEVTDKVT